MLDDYLVKDKKTNNLDPEIYYLSHLLPF